MIMNLQLRSKKAGAMFLVWLPALCALGARGDNPPAMRVDGNLLYKTTLPMDIDDCSGRQNPSRKGGGGYG